MIYIDQLGVVLFEQGSMLVNIQVPMQTARVWVCQSCLR